MKRKGWKIAAVAVLLFAAIGTTAFFAVRSSPEYALWTMVKDVQTAGVEGLKPHLTGDALELAEKLDGLSGNKTLDFVLSILDTDRFMDVLKNELMQVEWRLEDIEKSVDTAEVSLKFNYEDKLTGLMELDMARENGVWKISGIGFSNIGRS